MLERLRQFPLSPGIAIVAVLAFVSSLSLLLIDSADPPGMDFWLFARPHHKSYLPVVAEWNETRQNPEDRVNMLVIHEIPMERRLISGFVADTPVPDIAEVMTGMAGKFFAGPLEAVGFLDLTERLKEEGLMERINAPSFSPWMTRERVFGIPHDVHPVLLTYRADIVEAAGIDVSEIQTWDDFERVMAPLQKDEDGDGYPDRYVLNVGTSGSFVPELLMRQATGSLFLPDGRPQFATREHAEVAARIVTWLAGPNRMATLARAFDASGNAMYLEGDVLTAFMPDWLAGVFTRDLAGLGGKMKVMPLPAFEPGGRRTSVLGGTMIGIPKDTENPEAAWEFAKQLYTSKRVAEDLWNEARIISPIKAFWDDPMYAQPDPYFSGQPLGERFIEQAPHVPTRISSPYSSMAMIEINAAIDRTVRWAETNDVWDREALVPVVLEQLEAGQAKVWRRMQQNVFLDLPDSLAHEEAQAPLP
ncbi:MAG: extracellular solute-binding protein [Opitutales bacterium]